MNKVVGIILKIVGAAIAVAGVACLVKWGVKEFCDEKDEFKDEKENSAEHHENSSEKDRIEEVDVDIARGEAAEEIKLRHQEAAKTMKEMIGEIDKEAEPDTLDESEQEERLNFDDIDARLDKLFEED